MSVTTVSVAAPNSRSPVVANRATRLANVPVTPPRPAAWLPLPDVTGQQRFVGLYRIDKESNFVALNAAGNFTVDWGDGTTTDHDSSVSTLAQKQYDYSTIPDTGEAELGYRQVIIQVYPQAGQNLTLLNLQRRHSQSGLNSYHLGWLEIAINGSNLTTITIGGFIPLTYLARATIGSHALTSMASLFSGCRSLQFVSLRDTAAVTNMTSLFTGCVSLESVPLFNTSAVTDMTSMFNGCVSLVSVPLFNTAAVTNMSNMFFGCTALPTVPLFNTAAVTNMTSMFQSCSSLVTVPLFNTAAVTNMGNMFQACSSLATVPLFNTAAVTSMGNMFQSCSSLVSVPLFNTAAVTSMGSMFNSCTTLATVPLFNTAAVTSMSSMFANCSALVSVPSFNTAAVTTMSSMFQSCFSLSSAALSGTVIAHSFASCKLSATALNAIYTALGAPGTTRIITVSGNWGASTANSAIATAKNWQVTG